MFGWRKRIGGISPSVLETLVYDFFNFAPEGVGFCGISCNISGWAEDQYEHALATVIESAQSLAAREVDFIIHFGVPLVVAQGKGYDEELIDRIESGTGVPATTSIRSAMNALWKFKASKIAIASPYPEEENQKTAQFLSDYGFEVMSVASLGINFKGLHSVSPGEIYRFAGRVLEGAPDAEALYIPCPQWPAADVVETIETDYGKPVVASSQADFWQAFSRLGLRDPIEGYGSLLASLGTH